MLILEYILYVIAFFCTLMFICGIISDLVSSPNEKAFMNNISIEKLNKNSEILRIVLIIIMSIVWPVLIVFF